MALHGTKVVLPCTRNSACHLLSQQSTPSWASSLKCETGNLNFDTSTALCASSYAIESTPLFCAPCFPGSLGIDGVCWVTCQNKRLVAVDIKGQQLQRFAWHIQIVVKILSPLTAALLGSIQDCTENLMYFFRLTFFVRLRLWKTFLVTLVAYFNRPVTTKKKKYFKNFNREKIRLLTCLGLFRENRKEMQPWRQILPIENILRIKCEIKNLCCLEIDQLAVIG